MFDYYCPMNTRALEALSDENRYAIVELLSGGEKCVCEVSEGLGISNALASHHLKKLREAGLVETRRDGAWLHCGLRRESLLEVAEALRALAEKAGVEVAGSCCGPTRAAAEGASDE